LIIRCETEKYVDKNVKIAKSKINFSDGKETERDRTGFGGALSVLAILAF
jgi:hypothetical protein